MRLYQNTPGLGCVCNNVIRYPYSFCSRWSGTVNYRR